MYQPEMESRKRGGGGVNQHVRQQQREKGGNMCQRDGERLRSGESWREPALFNSCSRFLLFVPAVHQFWGQASLKFRLSETRSPQEKEDGASQWNERRKGKMEEVILKAALLGNHLLSSISPLLLGNTTLRRVRCVWREAKFESCRGPACEDVYPDPGEAHLHCSDLR